MERLDLAHQDGIVRLASVVLEASQDHRWHLPLGAVTPRLRRALMDRLTALVRQDNGRPTRKEIERFEGEGGLVTDHDPSSDEPPIAPKPLTATGEPEPEPELPDDAERLDCVVIPL